MSVQPTSYSKQLQSYELAQSRIESLIDDTQSLPQALQDKLKELKKFFKNYDMTQHQTTLKVLDGKILSDKEILEIVKEATGYTKWSLTKDSGNDFSWMTAHFALDVEKMEIRHVMVERSSNSRNDIYLIQFYILPGHVYIEMDTSRANWGSKYLVTNEDVAQYLDREMG